MEQQCCQADGLREGLASEADPEDFVGTAGLLRGLADPVRLRLFLLIAEAPVEICVCDLDDVGVSQPTVSHHLKKLRGAGLITSERRGTWVYYRLTEAGVQACRGVAEFLRLARTSQVRALSA
ncbi:ArsR/SmtB family transcription factor [Nesterenkonia marinintestina]|uniref:ArsR/SmtB family transcription factor n=1 Tax=Nesterenkonia marinintestina TaxID=2979865 RepID=UPI0021BEDB7D|nr:metalloregulator ArsR/SmtB family transcription factor [Nesterenkonia sp. GX14115]